jgi:hypothetical protein
LYESGYIFPNYGHVRNGEVDQYEDVPDLIMNLEDFDSDIDTGCKVLDSKGRPLRLKLVLQDLVELDFLE